MLTNAAILTEREIGAYMKADRPIEKRLYVSPFFEQEQLGDTSIDLRLGQRFLVSKPTRTGEIDITELRHGGRKILNENYHEFRVRIGDHFTLHPGDSVQVGTMEYLGIPYDLQGTVSLRKSVSDLLINANEVRVHPGHRGIVTLTLTSSADIAIKLYPGIRIAELMLQRIQGTTDSPRPSRYHAITTPTPSLIFDDEDLRYFGPRVEPMIIGVVSTIAAGRSIAVHELTDIWGFAMYSLASILRAEAEWQGIAPTRLNLQALGQNVRGMYGDGYLAERLRNDKTWLETRSMLVVVDSFKTVAEYLEFKKQRRFTLLGIDAPQEIRWRRICGRQRQGDPKTYEEFIRQDETDRGLRGHKHGQAVDELLAYADVKITNDGTLEEFRRRIDALADSLLNPAIRTQWGT